MPNRLHFHSGSTPSEGMSHNKAKEGLVLAFDQNNSEILESMTRDSRFSSIAETVSTALRVFRGLQGKPRPAIPR